MAKHSRPSRVTPAQRILLTLAAVLAVVLVGWGGYRLLSGGDDPEPVADQSAEEPSADPTGDGADDPTGTDAEQEGADDGAATSVAGDGASQAQAAGEATCAEAVVWAAPAIVTAVEQAAERAEDDCLGFVVEGRGSAAAQSALREGEEPDVWIPDSAAWPQLMSDAGVDLEVGDTVASSPVVLAGAPQVLAGLADLGMGADSSWPEVLGQLQQLATSGEEPPAQLRLGDPRTDPATMALLGAASDQLGDWTEPGSDGRTLMVVLAQNALQGDPLAALSSDPTTLVPATEQQLARAAEQGTELMGMAPGGSAGVVRMPLVRLAGAEAEAADAVQALTEELTSDQGGEDLLALGLRPGADGPAPGVAGVPETLTTDAPDPDAAQLGELAQAWTVIAPQSRILALIDISGSMREMVGADTTRIDLTRQAAQTALTVIPDQTGIGLWYFSTSLDGADIDYLEAIPLRALDEEAADGVTQREALLAETQRLTPQLLVGDTGLNDALWAAYQQMQNDATPDAISSVLLLTDGINDDTTGGLEDDEVVQLLAQARESGEHPVTVVLIGMGPEADEAALARLAEAAGGESMVLRDPSELPQVFVDVVARRAGG